MTETFFFLCILWLEPTEGLYQTPYEQMDCHPSGYRTYTECIAEVAKIKALEWNQPGGAHQYTREPVCLPGAVWTSLPPEPTP